MTVFVDAEVRVRRDRLALDGISEEASDRVLNHSTEKELPWLRGTADILVDGTKDTTPTLVALEALMVGGENQNSR